MAAPTFELVPTRNPNEFQFRVSVDATNYALAMTPKLYTPYGETKIALGGPYPGSQLFDGSIHLKDYIYVNSAREGNKIWFYFGKNKTEEEQLTPFREFTLYQKYNWPPVLRALSFAEDDRFPISTTVPDELDPTGTARVYSPRVTPRSILVPATLALCECIVEQFIGPRPFPAESHPQPTTGIVNWDFNGSSGSINCLHPRVVVPAPVRAYRVIANGTVGSVPAPQGPETIFPPTNFEDWAPFVKEDDISIEIGMYFRQMVTIYPPPQNDPVLQ